MKIGVVYLGSHPCKKRISFTSRRSPFGETLRVPEAPTPTNNRCANKNKPNETGKRNGKYSRRIPKTGKSDADVGSDHLSCETLKFHEKNALDLLSGSPTSPANGSPPDCDAEIQTGRSPGEPNIRFLRRRNRQFRCSPRLIKRYFTNRQKSR